jgi:hypothetical protein
MEAYTYESAQKIARTVRGKDCGFCANMGG